MSTGGIFTLTINDRKQDRMLTATRLLNDRLMNIERSNMKADKSDPTPTLTDIHYTHLTFLHRVFKPHVSIAYEYNRVQSSRKKPQLGDEVQFPIPSFGDFFHDMVVHLRLGETTAANAAYFDDPIGNPLTGSEKIGAIERVGERLIERTRFTICGNP